MTSTSSVAATFASQTSNIGAIGPKLDKLLSVSSSSLVPSSASPTTARRPPNRHQQAEMFLKGLRSRADAISNTIEITTTRLLPPPSNGTNDGDDDGSSMNDGNGSSSNSNNNTMTIAELATMTKSSNIMAQAILEQLSNELGWQQQSQQQQQQKRERRISNNNQNDIRPSRFTSSPTAMMTEQQPIRISQSSSTTTPSSLLNFLSTHSGPLEQVLEADYETDDTGAVGDDVRVSETSTTSSAAATSANSRRSPSSFSSPFHQSTLRRSPSSWKRTATTATKTPPPMNRMSFSNSTNALLWKDNKNDEDEDHKEQDGGNNDEGDNGAHSSKTKFLHRVLNYEFRDEDDMITLESHSSTVGGGVTTTIEQQRSSSIVRPTAINKHNNNNSNSNSNSNVINNNSNIIDNGDNDTILRSQRSSYGRETLNRHHHHQQQHLVNNDNDKLNENGIDFLTRMEGMLERVEESILEDDSGSSTPSSSQSVAASAEAASLKTSRVTFNHIMDNDSRFQFLHDDGTAGIDEPSRPSDEMNASWILRGQRKSRHDQDRLRSSGGHITFTSTATANTPSAPGVMKSPSHGTTTFLEDNTTSSDNDDDGSSFDDSTNVVPTVVQDKQLNGVSSSSRKSLVSHDRHHYGDAVNGGPTHRRPSQILFDINSAPSPAHTNITMDNTFGFLDDESYLTNQQDMVGVQKNNSNTTTTMTMKPQSVASKVGNNDVDPDLDDLSVMTPILDRYRVESSNQSSSIKVVPNQRRHHPSHEAYRKKKLALDLNSRPSIGRLGSTDDKTPSANTRNYSAGGSRRNGSEEDIYQGITPIMSNVPPSSAFQSPPPTSKASTAPVSSVTSRKKKVYPKTPVPKSFRAADMLLEEENSHPNSTTVSSSSPLGPSTTGSTIGLFVVPRLRSSISTTASNRGLSLERPTGLRLRNENHGEKEPKRHSSKATSSSSLTRARMNWERSHDGGGDFSGIDGDDETMGDSTAGTSLSLSFDAVATVTKSSGPTTTSGSSPSGNPTAQQSGRINPVGIHLDDEVVKA